MSVRSELEEATGLKSEKGEKLAAFKLRLVEAVDDLKEAEYKALPRAARKWVDEAVEAYNKKRELEVLPAFPEDLETEDDEEDLEQESGADEADAEEAEGEEDEPEADDADAEEDEGDSEVTHVETSETGRGRARMKKAKATPTKSAKATTKKTAPPSKAKKGNDGGGGKGLDYARKLLAKNIGMTAEELREKVKGAGYEVSDSTLSTGASGFRAAVRALQNAGKLKANLLD